MTLPYVRLPFPKEESLAEIYHENTKLRAYVREVPAAPGETPAPLPPLAYGEARALPDPRVRPIAVTLEDAIRERRSRRAHSGEPVGLDELSKLLHLTYGVTGEIGGDGEKGRAAPSAGARYPLELFVAALRVDGLASGVWHYAPSVHGLEPVRSDVDGLAEAFLGEPALQDAALVLLVGAVFSRTTSKYDERGYRLVLLDAGHAGENALLVASAMGLTATGVGGFVDDELNALCLLDGVDENVVYAIAVGQPRPD